MKLALAVLGVSLVLAGCATGPKEEDHAAHHAPGATAPAPAAPTPGQRDAMMMKSMQEMHDKMMAAKTPEERAALMQEHRKLMHDGMGMGCRMHGDQGRMGMDREATKPPAAR